MDQFDAAWKLLAGNHPEAFLRLFVPDLAAQMDWNRQYCQIDNELTPPAGDSVSAVRHPDVLLLITLLDGSSACLHIEIQCRRDKDFAQRMAIYHSRLHDRFSMPVISVALLADPGLRWRPDSYQEERDGCGMTVRFRTIKLMDFRDQLNKFATRQNVSEFAAATHLLALQTRRSAERRRSAKLGAISQLYAGTWNSRELSDLRQVIDLMMPSPRAWITEAKMTIHGYYEADAHVNLEKLYEADKHADKNSIAYIMWETTDRRGRMKGLAEGLEKGLEKGHAQAQQNLAELVEQQLTTRFGSLPPTVHSTLCDASHEQLKQLALALLRVRTLDDALVIAGLIA